MARISTYALDSAINDNDKLIGTDAEQNNQTKNFSLSGIADYVIDRFVDPDATDFHIPVFNQGGVRITDSIITQNSSVSNGTAGTAITISGNLSVTESASIGGNLSVAGSASIDVDLVVEGVSYLQEHVYANGNVDLGDTSSDIIKQYGTLELLGPVKDSTGTIGNNEQVLVSNAAGQLAWENYQGTGLEYQAAWNADTNVPDLTSIPLDGDNTGKYWVVSTPGTTDLGGITNWNPGDWAIVSQDDAGLVFWDQIDNSGVDGVGVTDKLAVWTSATTLGSAPITINGNDTSFAGNINLLDTGKIVFSNPNPYPASAVISRGSGEYSVQIGGEVTPSAASGSNSIAMGFGTSASGATSTAMGSNTQAIANFSTAIGTKTTASGTFSTAMGYETTASGDISTAIGDGNIASGLNSFATGMNTQASGEDATSMGDGTIASGKDSTSHGENTEASGNNSTTFGDSTLASGINSTAMGLRTQATNLNSTAFGVDTVASGQRSTATGQGTEASNDNATAMGRDSVASGQQSTAIGDNAQATNQTATAIGLDTLASGQRAVAIGENTQATAANATAIGKGTTADFSNSTAIGLNTTSSANASTSMGNNTTASGSNSTATGGSTVASGTNSFSGGQSSEANGTGSTAHGMYVTANSLGETTIGLFATEKAGNATTFVGTDRVFTVGNGTDQVNKSDALEILKNGNIIANGVLANLYNNDAAAAAGGVPIGGLYRKSGGAVFIRLI